MTNDNITWSDVVIKAAKLEELLTGDLDSLVAGAVDDLLLVIGRYDQQQEDLKAKLMPWFKEDW
jgi:hypothetical protein